MPLGALLRDRVGLVHYCRCLFRVYVVGAFVRTNKNRSTKIRGNNCTNGLCEFCGNFGRLCCKRIHCVFTRTGTEAETDCAFANGCAYVHRL